MIASTCYGARASNGANPTEAGGPGSPGPFCISGYNAEAKSPTVRSSSSSNMGLDPGQGCFAPKP